MEFFEKVVLITGAAGGIGKETALKFAKAGAKLVITDCNSSELQKVGKECELVSKIEPLLIIAELTNETDIEKIIDETVLRFSSLHILINIAGIPGFGTIENTSLGLFDNIFKVNVRAPFQLTSKAVPHLVKTKGIIINISSQCSVRPYPGMLAYCMSKSAIDQMTKCIALELADKGIRVNSVNPGVVKTNFSENNNIDPIKIENIKKRYTEKCPLKRMADAEEIANAILFLCSDSASFITGVNFLIDGGWHLSVT